MMVRMNDKTGVISFGIKCMAGICFCYCIFLIWHQFPFDWATVSVALALSFDNSNRQAVDRMIANTIGCTVGLLLFPFPIPYILSLVAGIILVVMIGSSLNHIDAIRAALAAFLIVMIEEKTYGLWYIPIRRGLAVMTGCMTAFMLTISFNLLLQRFGCKNKDQ